VKPKPSLDEVIEELRRLRVRDSDRDRDRESFLHEISVYQEELLAQNEALAGARAVLEEARDRYIELYDFAPNGYLTLDQNGVIRECNLTSATMFGHSKPRLIDAPLLGFIHVGDRARYLEFLRRCRTRVATDVEVELQIVTPEGRRSVQLLTRRRIAAAGDTQYLTSIIDVSERKRLERERDRIARENAALAGRVISVQDDERTRIARNLHDDIGQELTALKLMVELLASEPAPSAIGAQIARVQRTVEALDRKLHFVASELRPAALDLGIVAALEQFVRQWSSTFGIPVDFCSHGTIHGALTPDVETHLYRITQEALNNASKHAGAAGVAVLIERVGADLMLQIRDDGQGFDLAAAQARETGLGLAGMRERAQLIGGKLEIYSMAGRGTTVTVRLSMALVRRESEGQQRP